MDGFIRSAKRNDIGALWIRKDKYSKEYFTGHIFVNGQKIDIVVFDNTMRTKDNQPQMVIREDKLRQLIIQRKWGEE